MVDGTATSQLQLGASREVNDEIIGANQTSNRLVLHERSQDLLDKLTPAHTDLTTPVSY